MLILGRGVVVLFIYLFYLAAGFVTVSFKGINTCKSPWCHLRLVQLGEETALEGPHSILQWKALRRQNQALHWLTVGG